MDVNSCTGHPCTAQLFINMENVQEVNMCISGRIKHQ